MAKQKNLLTLLTGIAMGAAASFLSKEENREKTKKVILNAASSAKKAKAKYDANPDKFKKEALAKGKKIAKKAVKRARA
ncbi:MAG: hypothetical protein COU65_04685 [Candidatus Pacebacteria bacterium CG10_big_fil_rev_8_21_14_0_10_42_12]|nr:hypothetical protein [Candidatus Paceibacterota bacterium]PIR62199.1 MAG: hypothetical protein COU65_04685 [Candidatus Pacebacteria bacterium CG10_big_fil_rev_8_21_14_0_10_42_12]